MRATRIAAAMAGAAWAACALLSGGPASAVDDPAVQVLIDTVGRVKNTMTWTVDPRMAPQIGQSFTVDRPLLVTQVVLHPDELAFAKKAEYLVSAYKAEHFTYLHDRGSTGAVTVLNIWKSDGTPIPTGTEPKKSGFDVAAGGFTNVYSRSYDVPVTLGQSFTLPLEPAVRLEPGTYLAAWYFQFPDKRVFGVRFWGEVSGHSQGQWFGGQWVPTVCRYAPMRDTSPPGTSAYIADQWSSPYGIAPSGPPPGTIGYQTWFRQYTAKTPGCQHPDLAGFSKKGVPIDKNGRPVRNPYHPRYQPMNTGDLDMQLIGSPL